MVTTKALHNQQVYYYKGIYPVDIVPSAVKLAGSKEIEIRAKCHFQHTSNYYGGVRITKLGVAEKRWIKPGDTLKVPAKLVWNRHRDAPKGHL